MPNVNNALKAFNQLLIVNFFIHMTLKFVSKYISHTHMLPDLKKKHVKVFNVFFLNCQLKLSNSANLLEKKWPDFFFGGEGTFIRQGGV